MFVCTDKVKFNNTAFFKIKLCSTRSALKAILSRKITAQTPKCCFSPSQARAFPEVYLITSCSHKKRPSTSTSAASQEVSPGSVDPLKPKLPLDSSAPKQAPKKLQNSSQKDKWMLLRNPSLLSCSGPPSTHSCRLVGAHGARQEMLGRTGGSHTREGFHLGTLSLLL